VPARAWDRQRHAELVGALVDNGRHVVVTGGPEERLLTAYVRGARKAAIYQGGDLDLAALAEVLAGAVVVVSGNTGPAHLAAAVGTPVVSLFAPTVPAEQWRPWGVPHTLLGAVDIGCAGCRCRICPVPGHPCLDIQVGDVVRAVEKLACDVAAA
jgi:ADP-heptose:LPS heptosyltransferase